MDIQWNGRGVYEIGISNEARTLVKVSREFFGPLESDNYRSTMGSFGCQIAKV